MASDCVDGDYLGAYRRFFTDFLASVDPQDQLPVRMSSHDLTEAEIVGEIIHVTLQYMNQKSCPPSLQSYIVHLVIQEIQTLCKKQPELCGWKHEENTYASLKLMQAVTSKVNEICLRYLDNSRLALLPPPPSTPMPQVSAYCIKNYRRKMEDRHVVLHDLHTIFSIPDDSPASYYAVFDGHGGQEAAAYCATHLHQYLVESTYYPKDPIRALRDAFVTTDAHFIEKANKYNLNGGTTAVCALLLNGKLYIAWVGDSLATLTSRGKARHLVNPHKPDRSDETKRVSEMGGFLVHYGTWRVNGHLSVSRAIGDAKYKPCVTADPEILCIDLNGTEDFLIIGSDGFWDVIDEVHASHRIYQSIRENPSSVTVIAEKLVLEAKSSRSRDNISVIVVFLTDPADIISRPENSHELLAKLNIFAKYLHDLETNPQFAEMTDAYWKQSELLGEENRCFYEVPSNGKHAANAPDYDDEDEDEDLGPETNVDAVDEATEKCTKLEDLSRELFKEKTDERFEAARDDDDDTPPSPGIKSNQHVLIPEADNVADSEDSEDEWNYYRIDPNKEKDSAPDPAKESSKVTDVKESEYPVSLEEDQERLSEKEIALGELGDALEKEKEKEADSPELINTNICPEEKLQEDVVSTQQQHQEAFVDEMDFQLNPNAAEFVPVSPPRPLQQRMNIGPDFPVSGSPLKRTPTMDDIPVPSQEEFEEEICQRPCEVEEKEASNGENLQRTEFTDYLVDKQKVSGVPGPGLDVSEISSTKAEFGDESSTSFMTATDLHKTGFSVMDDSFGGSEREEYDIARDPMAMSFTPRDFEVAFEKDVDLNAVHDLSDADLVGCQNGFVPEDRPVVQSPDIHLELATLITPETDHPPHTEPFPDTHIDSLLDVSSSAEHQEVLESTLLDGKESRTRDTSKMLDIELDRHSSSDQDLEKEETEQTSKPDALLPESEQCKSEASPVPDSNQEELAEPLGNGVDLDLHQTPVQSAKTPDIITTQAEEVPEVHQQDSLDNQSLVSFTQEQAAPSSPAPDTAETVSPQPLEPEISSPISQDDQICTLAREESPYFAASPDPIPAEPFVAESLELKVQSEENIEEHRAAPEVDVMQNPFDLKVQPVSTADTTKLESEISDNTDFVQNWDRKFQNIQNPFVADAFSSPIADTAVPHEEASVQECPFSQQDSSQEIHPQGIDNKIIQLRDDVLCSITSDNKGPQENGIEQIEVAKVDELKPKHDIIDSNVHHIETHSEDISKRISGLDLSESLQEFTGLEKELEPKQVDIEKVESQEVLVDTAEEAVEKAIVPEVVTKEADQPEEPQKPLEPVVQSVPEEKVILEDVPKDTPSPEATAQIVKEPKDDAEIPKDTVIPVAAAPVEEKSQVEPAVAAVAAAGTAAAVAGAAAARSTKTSKAKPAPKGTKAPVTSKTAPKSSPTSPTKSLISKTTSATSKKPLPSTVSRPKQLEAKSTTPSSVTKTTLSPKPTTLKATSSRPSATGPKPKTTISTKPTTLSTDKKPTPNGDVKSPAKSASSRLSSKPAGSITATKSTLVKSSTTSRPTSGTSAPKPRPTSAAPASKPLTKSTISTTSTAAARPKTAPSTSTVTKTRLSTTRSPVTDKQIKETANKQISSARTSSVTTTKTARATATTTASSSTTIKRTATKTTTGSSPPARKPAPISRPGAKSSTITKTSTKTSVTAGKSTTTIEVVQNGVCELQMSKTTTTTSNNIEEDVPKKDVSPIAPPSDNQLIMAAD